MTRLRRFRSFGWTLVASLLTLKVLLLTYGAYHGPDPNVTLLWGDSILPEAPVAGLVMLSALCGAGVVFSVWRRQGLRATESQLKAERYREKAEVSVEIAQDKVKALEAKIQTLEHALSQALARKS